MIGGWGISYEVALRWISLDVTITDDKTNIVSGNVLVQSGIKPLLIQIVSPYSVTRGHCELTPLLQLVPVLLIDGRQLCPITNVQQTLLDFCIVNETEDELWSDLGDENHDILGYTCISTGY